jgi:hypothetical protein
MGIIFSANPNKKVLGSTFCFSAARDQALEKLRNVQPRAAEKQKRSRGGVSSYKQATPSGVV